MTRVSVPGKPETLSFVTSAAAIVALGEPILINRACLLSLLVSGGANTQTVFSPHYSSVRMMGLEIIMPGTILTAASVPTLINITVLGDTSDNAAFTFVNPQTNQKRFWVPFPRGCRAFKPCRSLIEVNVDDSLSNSALGENLFAINATGISEQDITFRLHFKATRGLASPAIITATASGLTGLYYNALDCIAPTSTGGSGVYPTLTVGSWALIPDVPAGQGVFTKPAAFTRTIG